MRPRRALACTQTLTDARGCGKRKTLSPLVRLLLSMYIAQQSTNPVIKRRWCGERAALPVHGTQKKPGHTLTHARAHTGEGGPGATGTVRTLFPDRLAGPPTGPASGSDALGSAQRGRPVCARRAVAEEERRRERERENERGREWQRESAREGERCRFHDNKLR